MQQMLSFMDAYTLWRAIPFPRGGFKGELPEIKGELVTVGQYAIAVIHFVEDGVFKPVAPGVLELLDDLLDRIEPWCEDPDEEIRSLARTQHAYAALLRIVYAEFLRLGGEAQRSDS